MKNNNMKLIMENWRKFSTKLESVDKSKVLIETKTFSGNLQNLLQEHQRRSISQNQFEKIIIESIENDLKEADYYLKKLEIIKKNPLLAEQEGFLGKAKQFISSAATAIKNAFVKTFQVIKDAPFQVLFLKNKIESQIKQFSKENPQKAKLLADVLKVAMAAAAVYAIYKLGVDDAAAAVKVKGQLVQGDEMKGFEILDYIQSHASELNVTPKDITQIKQAFQGEGDKTAALGKLAEIVNKAQDLMDASYQQAMQGGGSFEDIKPAVDAASDAAKQAIDAAAQKAAGVAGDVGAAASSAASQGVEGLGKAAHIFHSKAQILQKLKEMGISPEDAIQNSQGTVRKIVAKLLQDKQITKDAANAMTSQAGNYAASMLKAIGALK